MKSCDQEEKLGDDADPEMLSILKVMLEANETITARAVAKKHPKIKHASSITRHPGRSDLLSRYQTQQGQFRALLKRQPKRSQAEIASQMAAKDTRIAELQRDIELLQVSHLTMIQVVGEMGGMGRWLKFFEPYREARERLMKLGATPVAHVREFTLLSGAGGGDADE